MLIKIKAFSLIVLIILTSFTLYIPKVEAQQKFCCEKTKDNSFCVYTEDDNCAPGSRKAPAFCEDTTFCTLGCCFDSETGECFSNTAQSECTQLSGTWQSASSCLEVQQCSIGCCQLNNQAFLSTLTKCKQVSSQYSSTEPKFDASIQDEFSCLNSVRSQEVGCCVQAQGQCTFTTREQCGLSENRQQPAQETNEQGEAVLTQPAEEQQNSGFYPNTLCSSDILSCDAARQHHLSCYNEEVYWFDSQNNRENVFLGNSNEAKTRSYNNGKVLNDPGCEASPNDPNCGNCDYTKGTLCSDKDGTPKCIDLNCKGTSKFENSLDAGGNKELGESWCIFDGEVGFAQDKPGSRHFRSSCINGEEIIEPCRDFREEICVQSFSNGESMTGEKTSPLQAFTANLPPLLGSRRISNLFSGSGYSEAACRDNRWEDCFRCNEFSSGDDAKSCCNEISFRDCYFLESGISNKGGTCVPNVPPGLRFWSEQTQASTLDRQLVTNTEQGAETSINNAPTVPGDDHCAQANEECEVGFSRTTFSDWECTYNCQCLKEEAFIAAHSVCRSIGDCGANYNYIGKLTRKGFDVKFFGPKGEKAIPDNLRRKLLSRVESGLLDDALVKEPKVGGKPKDLGGIKGFFKKSAIPLSIIGATGVLGAALNPVNVGQGLIGGLTLGFTYPLGLLGSGIRTLGPQTAGQAFTPLNTQLATFVGSTGGQTIKVGSSLAGQTFKSAIPITTGPGGAPLSVGSQFTGVSTGTIPEGIISQVGAGNINVISGPQNIPLSVETLKATGIPQGQTFLIEGVKEGATLPGGLEGNFVGQATEGMTATQTTAIPSSTTAIGVGHVLGVLNTIAIIWTIYNIIDVLGAKTVTGKVQFICKAWEPPSGGSDCELCNPTEENPLPCSEYRCKSLGKACSIVNPGTTNELCVNTLPNDATSPRISADKEKMKNYQIQEEASKGFTITSKIPPFTAASLAIKTDEPAQCKFSLTPATEYDQMEFDFGSQFYEFAHNLTLMLPSELTTNQALQLTNGGKYTIYVRCADGNNNKNARDYYIKFEIDKGPDLTPPIIQQTSIASGTFIRNDAEAASVDLYLNEPASCKWDNRDIDYNLMQNSFSCSASGFDIELVGQGSYVCSSPLQVKKLQNEQEDNKNPFYFRCKDNAGNLNLESYRFLLHSTLPLEITSTSPNGTLTSGSNLELTVETSKGAENGISTCGYAQEDVSFTNMATFSNTSTSNHSQILQLQPGNYNFFITCLDKAGNEAEANIQFKVEPDTNAPNLLAVFSDTKLSLLTIITDEPTTCEYLDQEFQFGRGLPMTNPNANVHEANLDKSFYIIKCQDQFNNQAIFQVFP